MESREKERREIQRQEVELIKEVCLMSSNSIHCIFNTPGTQNHMQQVN